MATLWVLFLNGLVGFQLLDDGTPISLGLILGSAIAFFVGTGYVALDTAFSYTNTFVSSLSGPDNRNVALYVLYQLLPLICLAGFFLLETVLVVKVLGERKPMGSCLSLKCSQSVADPINSVSSRCRVVVRNRPDIPIRNKHSHMPRHQRENRRCILRDPLHPVLRHHALGFLVQHHGG